MKFLAVTCLLMCAAMSVTAQTEDDLTAKLRIFTSIGPGLKAVRRGADGRFYILASPTLGLAVYDATGKQAFVIPETQGARADLIFGEDCDVDPQGNVYVADRGANAIRIFAADGKLTKSFPVNTPISVAALPDGEIAVATLRQDHLVIVFDHNGRELREFGDPEPISERSDLNRYLSIGQLDTDAQGHLYYGFGYVPEPTVRQYDRNGYSAGQDVQYNGLEAMPAAQAMRKEIERQERKGDIPSLKRIMTAVGIDQANGEVWMALHSTLLHFDKDGNRRATYKLYTVGGARLEANVLLIEKDRIIVGSDPLGIYEFDRPGKKINTEK